MPIAVSELDRGFIIVDERATVEQVREQVADTQNKWTYIVVRLDNGHYAVLRWEELVRLLQGQSDKMVSDLLGTTLAEVPDLLAPRAGDAVGQASMGIGRARQMLSKMPGRRLVVLAEGEVIGLLAEERRGGKMDVDPAWLNGSLSLEVPKPAPTPKGVAEGVLVVEDEKTPQQTAEPEKRWINAEIQDHDRSQPLRMDEVYTLAFDVDVERRAASAGAAPLNDSALFESDENLAELTVQLTSDDFKILSGPGLLLVPRTGKSKNTVLFQIMPQHEGEGIINAVFLKNGVFIQVLTLKLYTAVPSESGVLTVGEPLGRPVGAAFDIPPRDLNLTILNTGTGFQIIMSGAVGAMATLPITLAQLDQMVTEVRQELQNLVHLKVGTQKALVYQAGIDIPPQVNQHALGRLAKVGYRLYQQVFYGPAADAQANLLGDRLRQMARQRKLKIQIFSQQFMLPWGVLYMADEYDPDHVDPELFLGLKHIIEHIPLQPNMQVIGSEVKSNDPRLTVSLNVNADIDREMRASYIADQERYWEEIRQSSDVQVTVRRTADEVTKALADTTTPDNILYFYCHAVSKSLVEAGGPEASTLLLSGGGRLTLKDLNIFAPTKTILPGAPLVFINACESAELSPLFYDGFVPYFMAKGARGVIGTECETPALFAAEWARRFFPALLTGKSLGQAFLDLRREFYYQHNNLMGLLYALYCDGDTQVVPGLQVT